jgi:hypothetical protein
LLSNNLSIINEIQAFAKQKGGRIHGGHLLRAAG